MHWTDSLKNLKACSDAIEWAKKYPTLEAAWAVCARGDWMLWYAGRVSGPPESDSRKRLIMATCACARLSLPYLPKEDTRPLRAIETAEAYCRGEAALQEVRAAAYAAANDAAYAAANAANAADAAAYAAADAAAAAARAAAQAQCTNIVRQHYPKPPTEN